MLTLMADESWIGDYEISATLQDRRNEWRTIMFIYVRDFSQQSDTGDSTTGEWIGDEFDGSGENTDEAL